MYLVKLGKRFKTKFGTSVYAVIVGQDGEDRTRLFYLDTGVPSDSYWADWQFEIVGILT